jgi:TolA-binding protein
MISISKDRTFPFRAFGITEIVRSVLTVAILLSLTSPAIAAKAAKATKTTTPAARPTSSESSEAARMADSLRHEAGRLAAQGRLDQALTLVEDRAADLPAVWAAMFAGKLELDGDAAARGYAGASADSAPEQMRGEAIFRQGQYHYAAGRYHLAIPQFRSYLAKFPEGSWSQESAYWMAHACLRLAQQRSDRAAYLDTALVYLRGLENKGRSAYYWPLARAAQARIYLMREDTIAAARALRDARSRAPAEEKPGVLLLSIIAEPHSPEAEAWEDSLRWNYPLSPETGLLTLSDRALLPPLVPKAATPVPTIPTTPTTPAIPAAPAVRGSHALQLGAFSQVENAERLRAELASKKIAARVTPQTSGARTLYRVLAGGYPDAATAQREGNKLLSPLGYAFRVVEAR